MSHSIVSRFRAYAAVVGLCAAMVLMGLAVHAMQSPQLHAAGAPDGISVITSTPEATPMVTKAVPSITGPAPLYAGEAPDSNPQAQLP